MPEIEVRDVEPDGTRGPWKSLDRSANPEGIRRALEIGAMESRCRLQHGTWSVDSLASLQLAGYRCVVLGPGVWRATSAALGLIARYLWPLHLTLGVWVLWNHDDPAALWFVTLVAAFLLSVWVHELGHVIAFQSATRGTGRGVLVAHGLSMHLARPALVRWQELVVVIGGPIAPAVVAMALAASRPPMLLLVMAGALAMSHALSLAVPVGDGLNLRAALGVGAVARRGGSHR